MTFYNVKVVSFTDGSTTFNAAASGVYAERGSATAKGIINRMEVTPWGTIYDMDGTDAADVILPKIWNDFVFTGAHPGIHAQYQNLTTLVGKHGTLTVKVPGAVSDTTYTASARMLPLPEDSQWEAPYKQGVTNWLMVRGIWQLKSGLT